MVKKGIMHAGERNRVVQALKIAKNETKEGKVSSVAKQIDQIIVLAFEIVTKEMTRMRQKKQEEENIKYSSIGSKYLAKLRMYSRQIKVFNDLMFMTQVNNLISEIVFNLTLRVR